MAVEVVGCWGWGKGKKGLDVFGVLKIKTDSSWKTQDEVIQRKGEYTKRFFINIKY
jgi:hypothetical protein